MLPGEALFLLSLSISTMQEKYFILIVWRTSHLLSEMKGFALEIQVVLGLILVQALLVVL